MSNCVKLCQTVFCRKEGGPRSVHKGLELAMNAALSHILLPTVFVHHTKYVFNVLEHTTKWCRCWQLTSSQVVQFKGSERPSFRAPNRSAIKESLWGLCYLPIRWTPGRAESAACCKVEDPRWTSRTVGGEPSIEPAAYLHQADAGMPRARCSADLMDQVKCSPTKMHRPQGRAVQKICIFLILIKIV